MAGDEDSLQVEIERSRRELAELSQKEGSSIERLDVLSREITLVTDLTDSLRSRDSVLTIELDALAETLLVRRVELDSAVAVQKEVLRAMFIRGRGGEWSFLLGGEGFSDFVSRFGYFAFLARERKTISEATAIAALRVEVIIDSTEVLRAKVVENRRARETELDSLRAAKVKKENVIAEIREDKETYGRAISAMEQSLAELREKLPDIVAGGEFEKYRGGLPWPTTSTTIIHPFGIVREQRFGTEFRNAGIDISTDPEESVRAVANGRVAQIYWLRGYGRIVILQHEGGFFSVYGNLGKVHVNKGETVSTGRTIGATAPEGWLEGAKLHFEIRRGKQEVNPIEWLIAA